MANERPTPAGEEQWRRGEDAPEAPPAPKARKARRPRAKAPAAPASTGDMQEVGALKPEEVEERRKRTDGEAPVHENPGDQNSG